MATDSTDSPEWESRIFPVREDMAFQRRYWVFQRFGWIALLAVMIAMILGLFSNGPLSRVTTGAETGAFAVEHQRFYRLGAAAGLTLRLSPGAAQEAAVRIDRAFLRSFALDTIRPTPDRSEAGANGLILTFRTEGRGGNVHFAMRPTRAGPAQGAISVGAGAGNTVRLETFVYP